MTGKAAGSPAYWRYAGEAAARRRRDRATARKLWTRETRVGCAHSWSLQARSAGFGSHFWAQDFPVMVSQAQAWRSIGPRQERRRR
jgi:hypothetical protein